MSVIDEEILNIRREDYDFIDYDNEKALFNTKIVSDMKHNGEIVEVIGILSGKDVFSDRYIVRFNDGTIDDNIMNIELDFDYQKNKVYCEKANTKNNKIREER